MKNMELKLPKEKFIRVHRSFIVGLKYITSFNSSEVEIGAVKIPVGKNYKDEFLLKLRSKNIL
jgi:DNA-binding LytR/AlgR family response regulator